MAYIREDDDEQQGSGLNQALVQQQQPKKEEQPQQPEEATPQVSAESSTISAPTVKAMPTAQKAGTGTFANLRSYLQANQGNRIASAASQRLTGLTTGAQKGIKQAESAFGKQVEAGSLANRESALQDVAATIGAARQVTALPTPPSAAPAQQAPQPVQRTTSTISQKPVTETTTRKKQTGQAAPTPQPEQKTVTAPAPAPAPILTQEQINARNKAIADIASSEPTQGLGYFDRTGNLNEAGKTKLGDKASIFQEELNAIRNRQHPMDYGPGSANEASHRKQGEDIKALYDKYGLNEPLVEKSTTPSYFTPEQERRFADIINAEYAGPQSLQQAGLYQSAEQKTRAAQQALRNIGSASGRETFLRDIFARGRDYTEGQARLDALLLNVSPEAVGRLKEQATQTGDITSQLQRAENVSRALALGRTTELSDIQRQAREEYEKQRLEELTSTEKNIAAAKLQGQELGTYMQNLFKNANNKPVDLSATEASILGIKSGEGIYNLTGDQLVKLNQLRDERIITKDERARLEALVKLAELDKQKQLQTEYFEKYKDASLAGTQSVLDVINTQAIRDAINAEEQKFIKEANRLITGYGEGSARYSRGMFQGRGKVTAEAEFSKNLKGLLKKAGYDVTPEREALLSSPDVLKAIVRSAQTSGAKNERDLLKNALNILNRPNISDVSGAIGTGARSASPVEGINLSDIGGAAGTLAAASELDAALAMASASAPEITGPYALLARLATDADLREKVGATVGAIGGNELGNITSSAMESFDAAGGLTNMLGDIATLGSVGNFGSDLFGGGKSGARKKARAEAERNAALDLQKEIESALDKAGFERRSTILNREQIVQQQKEFNKQQKDIQDKIKGIEANQAKLQQYSQNPEFANLMGRTVKQDFFGPRTEAFPREQQLTNIDNELKSLREQLKTAPIRQMFRLDGGMTPTRDSIQSKIKALKDMQGLIKSDLNAQLDLQKKSLEELAPMIKQQQEYLSRVGGVEKRNVGLQALLKKLDMRNT